MKAEGGSWGTVRHLREDTDGTITIEMGSNVLGGTKRGFYWFVVILKERLRITRQPSPDGQQG